MDRQLLAQNESPNSEITGSAAPDELERPDLSTESLDAAPQMDLSAESLDTDIPTTPLDANFFTKPRAPLSPGLFITSTPIGNLEDITLRALRVLRSCDRIVCEDSRVSMKLLNTYQIKKPLIAYQDHNANEIRPQIIAHLQNKERIALISDAGTPLIADPGFKLVRECHALNIKVTTVPGATSLISGAILSGFPTHALTFLGFASNLTESTIENWRNADTTLIFFESPHKLLGELNRLRTLFNNRHVAVVREITKLHEDVRHGSFDELIEHFLNKEPRGEFIIALSPPIQEQVEPEMLDAELKATMQAMSLKDAVLLISQKLKIQKSRVYKRAIELSQSSQ
ncbi:MAG: 16S rRNA (cytidine(1402)-2'-O)-methyltransferase [Holosporales bacterium]|jgi:16S rRNA (cytidine1402-2'-O)-methyltransferase|nr:16S rRNA (cytidine(1402)-2'-O)-methyltransferase [Holosporales bacterium]